MAISVHSWAPIHSEPIPVVRFNHGLRRLHRYGRLQGEYDPKIIHLMGEGPRIHNGLVSRIIREICGQKRSLSLAKVRLLTPSRLQYMGITCPSPPSALRPPRNAASSLKLGAAAFLSPSTFAGPATPRPAGSTGRLFLPRRRR